MTDNKIKAVVFDIGNVVLHWDPRVLFRKLLPDEAAVDHFLTEVCPPSWNVEQDRGRDWNEAVEVQSALFPEFAPVIEAWHLRWIETIQGTIEGTVTLIEEIDNGPLSLHAITNFSAPKFQLARKAYPVLDIFEETIVSGEIGVLKPSPDIYQTLFDRTGLGGAECIFIDDSERNVVGAKAVGMVGIHFQNSDQLRRDLSRLGVVQNNG